MTQPFIICASIEQRVMCIVEDIVEKCKKRDRKAEEQLYKLFSARMFALCLRYSPSRTEAEDNFQDGFIRVFESIGQYTGKGSFEGWMKRIFINTALEKYRKNQSVQLTEDIPDVVQTETDDEEAYIPENVLIGFIEELPERYKLVFRLYVGEELQHKDIAAMLGISEGTSKSNLARAREILKKRIKEYAER